MTAGRGDPGQQHLLHNYAVWHLLRRLRRCTAGADTTHDQMVGVRQHVKAAIAFLDWLTARNLTLATCRQNDLDTWISGDQASCRRETGHFIRWAKQQKLTSLDFPATRWDGPSRVIDTEARWEQARRLLMAGLLARRAERRPGTASGHIRKHLRLSAGRQPDHRTRR